MCLCILGHIKNVSIYFFLLPQIVKHYHTNRNCVFTIYFCCSTLFHHPKCLPWVCLLSNRTQIVKKTKMGNEKETPRNQAMENAASYYCWLWNGMGVPKQRGKISSSFQRWIEMWLNGEYYMPHNIHLEGNMILCLILLPSCCSHNKPYLWNHSFLIINYTI